MSAWSKEELENLLEDVVNVLDLSDTALEKHGPEGTAPATLVRLVLEQKDFEIKMLRRGFVDTSKPTPPPADAETLSFDFYWQIVTTWATDMDRLKRLSTHDIKTLCERLLSITQHALLARPRAVEPECAGPSNPDNRKPAPAPGAVPVTMRTTEPVAYGTRLEPAPAPAAAEALMAALAKANGTIEVVARQRNDYHEALERIADDRTEGEMGYCYATLDLVRSIARAAIRPRAGDVEDAQLEKDLAMNDFDDPLKPTDAEAQWIAPDNRPEGVNTLEDLARLINRARANKHGLTLDWVELGILQQALSKPAPAPGVEKVAREILSDCDKVLNLDRNSSLLDCKRTLVSIRARLRAWAGRKG